MKVESIFEHAGLKCVVIMTEMGHRCGYVGVSTKHSLYGKGYSEKIGKFADIKNNSTEKMSPISIFIMALEGDIDDDSAVRIDCYFDVHGGITYADGGANSKYPIESDLWWFGYDCAHCDDGKDLSVVNEKIRKIEMMYPTHGIIRTLDYCIDECKNLAEQLVKFE